MPFISYAQNFEDVMLWRALKNVTNGFYVDVGANDPIVDSVTKAFYEAGWNGINIEPIKRHWINLCNDRPRDINLAIAAGEKTGTAEIFDTEIRGWSTLDQGLRSELSNNGIKGETYKVEVRSLSDVFIENKVEQIHFLKIDVEGFEKEVLEGSDFSSYRPWIVVAEATEPNSQKLSYQNWEPILLRSAYEYVYFDGINRYYLAKEHNGLKEYFLYPPCVFDEFTTVSHFNAVLKAQQAEVKAQQAEAKAQQAEVKALTLLQSGSMRITAPLRMLNIKLRNGKRKIKKFIKYYIILVYNVMKYILKAILPKSVKKYLSKSQRSMIVIAKEIDAEKFMENIRKKCKGS